VSESEKLEQRKHIRLRLMDSISELSDFGEQESLWLDPDNENPHFSWIEYSECFFDCTGGYDGFGELVGTGILAASEAVCIQPLNDALVAYSPPNKEAYDNLAILQDEDWVRVVDISRRTKQELLKLLKDSNEIKRLHD